MASRVLVVGAGGIGSTVCLYLASAGVSVSVLDHDCVDRSNLHRQIIHSEANEGKNKAVSAVERMKAINSSLEYTALTEKLTTENAVQIIAGYDLVVDATDNFAARYVINDACVLLGKPFVSGSAVGFEGQITVIVPRSTACYRCLYPTPSIAEACRSCANAGVLGPVPGMIGCWEAIEALKLILTMQSSSSANNTLSSLTGRQLMFDCASGESFCFDLPARDALCSVCGDSPSILSMADTELTLQRFHAEAEREAQCYLGHLEDKHHIDTLTYNNEYVLKSRPHLLVDVRSSVQFGLSSLQSLSNLLRLSSLEEVPSGRGMAIVNIPLHELRSLVTHRKDYLLEQLCKIQNSLTKEPSCGENESSSEFNVVVVCRRGVDSVVATRLLREVCESLFVLNLKGGLLAWKTDVDSTFPMY